MKYLHRLCAIAQGSYFTIKQILEKGEYAMQDGLQEMRELITRKVDSLREGIKAVKTDLKAGISSVKSEFRADIGAVKLELREESGRAHERLDKMNGRFGDVDEQLETLTTSVNAT